MFGSTILEVAIGLVLIYCLYSLLATTINEIISSILGLRAQKLQLALKRMLKGENPSGSDLGTKLFEAFSAQPMIKQMTRGGIIKRNPSYLKAADFSRAVVDSLKTIGISDGKSDVKSTPDAILSVLSKHDSEIKGDTARLLKSFLPDVDNDLVKFRASLEEWFNSMMDRTSGWYKRQTQWILFVIGLVLAMSFNVNTFDIVKRLSKDDNARAQMVQLATNYVKTHPAGIADTAAAKKVDSLKVTQRLDSLVVYAGSLYKNDIVQSNGLLGMGWTSVCDFWTHIWTGIIGWLITALAISLGSPFWFDLLSKLVQLRGTGPKPEDKKPEEKKPQ